MKYRNHFLTTVLFFIFFQSMYAQTINKSENIMTTVSNKEIVSRMYQTILNQKQFDQSSQFIDNGYLEEFRNANKPLLNAFPDIQFTIKEIFEDENKVITLYDWSGTHQNEYQKISATHKKITVEGISIYELRNGKIINSKAKPDKLSFFLQLGIIPNDFININTTKQDFVYFVDEFEIPKEYYIQFKEKLDYNRNFIKNINGFIKDEVVKNADELDNINIITIAIWKDEQSLNQAKKLVQSEYRRIGFDPTKFNQNLNIKMKRGTYSYLD